MYNKQNNVLKTGQKSMLLFLDKALKTNSPNNGFLFCNPYIALTLMHSNWLLEHFNTSRLVDLKPMPPLC